MIARFRLSSFVFRLLAAAFPLLLATAVARAQEWNQWRGPMRNGIVAAGPALATTWPQNGPAKLWSSESIPAEDMGGFSAVSLAGGRAFVYVNHKTKIPLDTRTIGEEELRAWGMPQERIPEDLAKQVEEARLSDARAKLKNDEVAAWVNQWALDHIPAATDRKVIVAARERLQRGKNALALDALAKLAAVQDKPFASVQEFEAWLTAQGFADGVRKEIVRVVPTTRPEAQDAVWCLDAATGKTLWKQAVAGTATQWGSSSTPLVAAGRVYVAGAKTVYALNAADGAIVWQKPVKAAEISSSPVLVDGAVVFLAGPLTAFDAATGEVRWTQPKVSGNNPSSILWTTPAKTYLLANGSGGVACVDPKDGSILWTVPGGGSTTPALSDTTLVVFNKDLAAWKLNPEKPAEKPAKLWAQPMTDRGTTPLIFQDHVYAYGNNKVFCVRLADGAVRWQEKFTCEIASPVLADGKVLGFVESGKTFLMLQANPEKYDLLIKSKALKMASCSTPTVAGGRLYLREPKGVSCYDLTAPEK